MRYLLIFLVFSLGSCNVAKKVFRHKDKSIIEIKRDSTGQEDTHVDTSRKSSLRTIESTDIIKPGINKKASSDLDLDLLKAAARKGKPLISLLLDSAGNIMGTISTSLDTVNNKLNQLTNLATPSEEYHHKKESNQDENKTGITDHHKEAAVKNDDKQQNENQDLAKDVKRSPAWIKIGLIVSGVVIVLLALFNRGNIWKWIKSKVLKM